MLWKNLAVLIGLAWVTTTFAAGKVVAESMDDALSHKIERPHSKSQKRGVANDNGRETSSTDGVNDPQYWNWDSKAEPDMSTDESFEPSVEDESEY